MIRSAKMAALLAMLSTTGHPSIAPSWHRQCWGGRPRTSYSRQKPGDMRGVQREVFAWQRNPKPATRRSRRVR
jgi:hypothetical protein